MSKAYLRREFRTVLDPSPAKCLLAPGWAIGIMSAGIVMVLLLGPICESLVLVGGKPFTFVSHRPIPFLVPYLLASFAWLIDRSWPAVLFAVLVLVMGEVMIGLVLLSESLQPMGFRQVLLPSPFIVAFLLIAQFFSGGTSLGVALNDRFSTLAPPKP